MDIQAGLTAHPTEAKRRSVIYQLWRLRNEFDDPDEVLEALWQTEEIHERKLEPLEEVDNTLPFFERTIFHATVDFYKRFDDLLKRHYPMLHVAEEYERSVEAVLEHGAHARHNEV